MIRPKPSLNPLSYVSPGLSVAAATAFCVDPECRFVGTNYHVALHGTPRKIKKVEVVQTYLATGPDDEGAAVNYGEPTGTKFTLSRDLALFELDRPLRGYRGIGYDLDDDLEPGQQVDIYAYPAEGLIPFGRRLLQFHARFRGLTTKGLLMFDYVPSGNMAITPGASGGVVVDAKTQQIVGILNMVGQDGAFTAYAVPVQALADFVWKVHPYLAERIFPRKNVIPPVSVDLYPKYVWPPVDAGHHRPEESNEVKLLRNKAQKLADSIRNFVAVQTYEWGKGSGNTDPFAFAAYEILVANGRQQFREYPDGTKYFEDRPPLPWFDPAFAPASEWFYLPQMVGTEFRLKVRQAPDAIVNGQPIKVFQYDAAVEDEVCGFESTRDFIMFKTVHQYTVSCHGEVWTDENLNILRISENDDLNKDWQEYRVAVTYGWLKQPGEKPPRLIPVTISAEVKRGKKLFWCRGQFMNYRRFDSVVKITPVTTAGLPH